MGGHLTSSKGDVDSQIGLGVGGVWEVVRGQYEGVSSSPSAPAAILPYCFERVFIMMITPVVPSQMHVAL